VAHYLGMELGGIKIKRFADGETYVQIQVGARPRGDGARIAAQHFSTFHPCMVSITPHLACLGC